MIGQCDPALTQPCEAPRVPSEVKVTVVPRGSHMLILVQVPTSPVLMGLLLSSSHD